MHGKTSKIFHDNKGIFSNITSPFIATRYHSLAVDLDTLPAQLKINAWTEDDSGNFNEIMGIYIMRNTIYMEFNFTLNQ